MDPDPERLAQLEARIEALKGQTERKPRASAAGFSQGEVAWRMVVELVTGMGLGLAIGYGIDTLAGTMPIFLVIFALFGFAAGIKTMLGTAKEIEALNAKTETQAAQAAKPNKTAAQADQDEGE